MSTEGKKNGGRRNLAGYYTYETIAELTGMSLNSVHQHAAREHFDIGNLESVLLFMLRYSERMKTKFMRAACNLMQTPEGEEGEAEGEIASHGAPERTPGHKRRVG